MLQHIETMTVQRHTFVVAGDRGAIEFRRAGAIGPVGDGLLIVHRVDCWSECGLDTAGPGCPGGPSGVLDVPAHIGGPGALRTVEAMLADAPVDEVWAELDALYARIMPDPEAALAVPAERPVQVMSPEEQARWTQRANDPVLHAAGFARLREMDAEEE